MGGPIVRTGTTPEFWKNWDQAFGKKKQTTDDSKKSQKSDKTAVKSEATRKVVKKAVKKAAKKSK